MATTIEEAIEATKEEDYLRGLTSFIDVYGTEDSPPLQGAKAAERRRSPSNLGAEPEP